MSASLLINDDLSLRIRLRGTRASIQAVVMEVADTGTEVTKTETRRADLAHCNVNEGSNLAGQLPASFRARRKTGGIPDNLMNKNAAPAAVGQP